MLVRQHSKGVFCKQLHPYKPDKCWKNVSDKNDGHASLKHSTTQGTPFQNDL